MAQAPYAIRGELIATPLVYIHKLANGSVDYVGMSARGLERPLGGGHLTVGPQDTLIVIPCESADQAAELERVLIVAIQPKRNVKVAVGNLQDEASSNAGLSMLLGSDRFREWGRAGGLRSAAARMAMLTPEERSALAKKAVQARRARQRSQRTADAAPRHREDIR